MKTKIMIGLLIIFFLATTSRAAEPQQPNKIPRIGYLAGRIAPTPTTPDLVADAFRHGLRDLGYDEGKNIGIEYRYAEGKEDRFPALVAELVQLKVDVIVAVPLPAILAAKQATKTIPIVMVTTRDPVAIGLVDSLSHPGGNITGITRLTHDLSAKRLELLKEAVPGISRVGVLGQPGAAGFKEYEDAARILKIPIVFLEVSSSNPDFAAAFQGAAKRRAKALVTVSGALLVSHTKRIADLAINNGLPSMHDRIEFVTAGGLMSYSSNDAAGFSRAAYYVDKILKGTKPADLPVEQPTKFEFVINLKTAKQIGLTIPPNVLARANRVIK